MTRPLIALLLALACAFGLVSPASAGSAPPEAPRALPAAGALTAAGATTLPPMPSRSQWYADVRHAMRGANAYLDRRVKRGGGMLAVNLDIDNTVLATHYNHRKAIPVMRRFVRHALRHHVRVLFNTGRLQSRLGPIIRQLRADGFHPSLACGRTSADELVVDSKQRCRALFVARGYRLILNIGNNDTDLVGGNYERAIKLPDYDKRLG